MSEDEFNRALLDDARAVEALRLCEERPGGLKFRELAQTAARLAREGWTPADPDLLAVQKMLRDKHPELASAWGNKNALWHGDYAEQAVLGAYKAGREAEAERAKVLVEPAEAIVNRAVKGTGANDVRWSHILKAAGRLDEGLKAYKAGKEAAQ